MKKTAPKSHKRNGHGPQTLPADLSPIIVQAVLEDAVMEAAADIAALSATLEAAALPDAEAVVATIVPETPEEQEIIDLLSVPFLGPSRVRSLADAGITTVDDLRTATADRIGGVKGVGQRNAVRIKEWLAAQSPASAPSLPPDPPTILGTMPLSASYSAPNFDPGLAASNQAIFDEMGEVDQAVTHLRERLGAKGQPKKLARQFDKIATVTSELAEGPDTLSAKQLEEAVTLLHSIADVLCAAVDEKKLTPKKLEDLSEALRQGRKALQKALGD